MPIRALIIVLWGLSFYLNFAQCERRQKLPQVRKSLILIIWKKTLKRVGLRELNRRFEKEARDVFAVARCDYSPNTRLCDFPLEFASQFEELRLLAANRVEGLARTLFEESFFFVEPALRFEES